MNKLVVLRLSYQEKNDQYQVIAEIGDEGKTSDIEMQGWLPGLSAQFLQTLENWKCAFSQLDNSTRLKVQKISVSKRPPDQGKESSTIELAQHPIPSQNNCRELADKLNSEINLWLKSSGFEKIETRLYQNLGLEDNVQIIICTTEDLICKLPWGCWKLLERYKNSEVCFNLASESFSYGTERSISRLEGLKVLMVIGDSENIDLEKDIKILNHELLKDTDVYLEPLMCPSAVELGNVLAARAWDIMFFSGHSETLEKDGLIYLKHGEAVSLSSLENSFKKAISNGLKLAIFNSCDGIGIARNLQRLQVPQVIVMREPIPDKAAHAFLEAYLKNFQALDSNSPIYLAERRAKTQLKGSIVCADWLPIVFQNHKVTSPVRGFITKGSFAVSQSNANSVALYNSIGIFPKLQFEDQIHGEDKRYKVKVIDPMNKDSIGKIQYKGGLWKAKIFRVGGFNRVDSISPGDDVCVVAREGSVCFVLPKKLVESSEFFQIKKGFEPNTLQNRGVNYLKTFKTRKLRHGSIYFTKSLLIYIPVIFFVLGFALNFVLSRNVGSVARESSDFLYHQNSQ